MPLDFKDFQGVNEGYVLELYDRYVADPRSVDAETRELFKTWTPPGASPISGSARPRPPLAEGLDTRIAVGAISLAESIRRYGHLAARIDPLGSRPRGNPLLHPEGHGVTAEQLKLVPATLINEVVAVDSDTMYDLVEKLRSIYCGTTGYDTAHIFVPEERLWLRDAIETGMYRAPKDPIDPVALLDRLTDVEVFEKFLHRTFPGKTRFSIEGVDMLVPILDEVLSESAEAGMRQAFIGMAHRGRLNVMAHVMGKPYQQILAEFKDPVRNQLDLEGVQWAGDVKYHLGASRAISGGERVKLVVSMPPNPSHLESINPVIEGMVRAAGTDASKPGPSTFDQDAVLPILIHGDAAFPGQGVVAETLNLHRLAGYDTGGTIHIIANNQIGFTTEPSDSYSTLYASGIARAFKIPIFHVNADDPEACVEVARLAVGYLTKFRRDVLIDLVGYRRYGHNEGDEPAFTQPRMYEQISQHPTAREMWARTLESRRTIEAGRAQAMVQERMELLQRKYDGLDTDRDYIEPTPEIAAPGTAAKTRTKVPAERLQELNEALLAVPAGFNVHRKLERVRDRRRQAFASPDERSIDWATAEELAYASILADGTPIRLTGEDVGRGTFSHRHAVLKDAINGRSYVPLQGMAHARASFEIYNSPLGRGVDRHQQAARTERAVGQVDAGEVVGADGNHDRHAGGHALQRCRAHAVPLQVVCLDVGGREVVGHLSLVDCSDRQHRVLDAQLAGAPLEHVVVDVADDHQAGGRHCGQDRGHGLDQGHAVPQRDHVAEAHDQRRVAQVEPAAHGLALATDQPLRVDAHRDGLEPGHDAAVAALDVLVHLHVHHDHPWPVAAHQRRDQQPVEPAKDPVVVRFRVLQAGVHGQQRRHGAGPRVGTGRPGQVEELSVLVDHVRPEVVEQAGRGAGATRAAS